MKLLFLDVDGVLNSADYVRTLKKDEEVLIGIDLKTMPLLKEVLDKTGAKIVLSSSWRGFKEHIAEYLTPALDSIGHEVFSETPRLFEDRGVEILAELNRLKSENEITHYAVLDDEVSDIKSYIPKKFVVKTSWEHGLQQEHVDKLIKILNKY